jgi:eukaryotic-like serine/threonine-protein kinase
MIEYMCQDNNKDIQHFVRWRRIFLAERGPSGDTEHRVPTVIRPAILAPAVAVFFTTLLGILKNHLYFQAAGWDSMSPERHAQIERIFAAAASLESTEREAYVHRACAGDAELRDQVVKLLAADQQKSLDGSAPTEDEEKLIFRLGRGSPDHLGRYHLLQKIGEGGMGEVWLAEQKEPVRRRVALKLVKAGMNTREVMARFESEGQALALMDHPAIAKVFDAGSTSDGAPYFVMEYVAGVPITTYCDNHRMSTRERLELFVHVCEGVQHAHQKAILHRDLKPSNILVTEVDGHAAPKIIDFGVAKALSQKLTADTMFTRVGALIGTPEYMSPEQAISSNEDIDTRTDVYSLGIIFYELLAGAPPIDLRKISFEEFLRRLREDEPPKPSTKIRTQDPATSSQVARKRHSEPLALAKQMRGDLDLIALKALQKDRAHRYSSPSDFAADIARYLKNEPVMAVPPSAGYRARKFVRRHRGPLVTACAVALVLIAAAIVSIRQSIRATNEAAVAQAVNDFLQNDLLAQASAKMQAGSRAKPDPHLEVRTALDRAAEKITGKFDRQPEVEAAIRDTIGQTYTDLGLYAEARKQLDRALELQLRLMGADNPVTVRTMIRIGQNAFSQGKFAEAQALFSRALDISRRVLGPEQSDTLSAMNGLANVHKTQGQYPQAEILDRQVLDIRRRRLGPENRETLSSMNSLAIDYQDEGKYADAEALFSETLEIRRRVLGLEHPDTLASMNNLSNVYSLEGRSAQAEALDKEALDTKRRVLGPDHPDTLISMTNVSNDYFDEGKYPEAETLQSQTLEISRRTLGLGNSNTLLCMASLANTYSAEGKYEQAEALLVQTSEIQRRVLGAENPDALLSLKSLADVYTAERKFAQAESMFKEILVVQRRGLGAEHPDTLITVSDLATMYQRQGKYSLAETYAEQALTGRRHRLGQDDTNTIASAADLALAYQSQGKFTESELLAREALDSYQKKYPDDWGRFRAESLLGASLSGLKKYAEAEPLLIEGYQGMLARKQQIGFPDRYHLERAHEWLVQLYQAKGQPGKAKELSKR